jgi:hypothetical protein
VHWIPDGDGRRCPQHDKRFPLGEPCPDCVTAIMPAIEVIEATQVDAGLEEYEGEVREFAKGARLASIELLKLAAPNPAAKWADIYLKSMRLVSEMRDQRLARESDAQEIAHEREMSSVKGARPS